MCYTCFSCIYDDILTHSTCMWKALVMHDVGAHVTAACARTSPRTLLGRLHLLYWNFRVKLRYCSICSCRYPVMACSKQKLQYCMMIYTSDIMCQTCMTHNCCNSCVLLSDWPSFAMMLHKCTVVNHTILYTHVQHQGIHAYMDMCNN